MYEFLYAPQRSRSYKNNFIVKEKLTIETKIIGYKNQGECILIFIRVDDVISFSALIDCYMIASVDKISDILREYHVSKLNFLCWTHPDLDHSKGLNKIIEKYVNEKTQIWIPEGVEAHEVECSREVQKLFEKLKQCIVNNDSDYSVYSASDVKDLLCYETYCFTRNGLERYPLSIIGYAPNSKIIRKQTYLDNFIKNDRSIFCVLILGQVRIFLTGDIENSTIELLPIDIIENNAHIMKIPHHGSDTSTEMIEVCSGGCDVACSTVYRMGSSRLPLDEVMEQYSLTSEFLYCTGSKDKEKEQYEYGMVTVNTNVLDYTYFVETEGNAELVSRKEKNYE